MNVFIESKSITSVRPCIIIRFLFFLMTTMIYIKGVVALDKHKEIIADLPTAEDFDEYLTSLENIVNFSMKNKEYVDMNFEFGLFLTTVNLKAILNEKWLTMNVGARTRLEKLLSQNDELAKYYHDMLEKPSGRGEDEQDRKISTLFYNESSWPRSVDKFNIDLLKQTPIYTPAQLKKIYGEWANYEKNVFDQEKYEPLVNKSDSCIAELARKQSILKNSASENCRTTYRCKQWVKTGPDFGFLLSLRILFIVVARFAVGCIVFSENEDKLKVDKFCIRSFHEAQYTASNNFQQLNFMMENIVLCGLFGHAQFFRKSWMSKLLESQTSEGCLKEPNLSFVGGVKEGQTDNWASSNNTNIMGGGCHSHLTTVGAPALASSLRYIMERYF